MVTMNCMSVQRPVDMDYLSERACENPKPEETNAKVKL